MKRKPKAAIDRQLDHWEATDKEQRANRDLMAEKTKHDFDWFDLETYQKTIYGKGWHK